MALETGDFDATLAAAAGSDPDLMLELRAAFLESARQQVDLLKRARCDGNWSVSAMRLKGLGASFHEPTLVSLATEALDGAPGDPGIVKRIEKHLGQFEQI